MTVRPSWGRLVMPANAPRDQWLAARRLGITATDVVKIVGLSQYGTALDVYLDKRLGDEDRDPGEDARWGLLLEDPVAREWARRSGCQVRRLGLMRRPTRPHHLASCDRRLVGARELLEVKTRNVFANDFADGLPERVTVQTQWQMHVTGADRTHVAALIGGQQLVEHVVERDQVLIDYLISEAERVWAAVQFGVPPEVPTWQLTTKALDRLHPDRAGAVEVDPEVARPLLTEYTETAAGERFLTKQKEQAKVALIALLGDAEQALVDGQPAYSYRRGKPAVTIPAENARALLEAHPDMAEFAVTKPGRAAFALASTKKEKTA